MRVKACDVLRAASGDPVLLPQVGRLPQAVPARQCRVYLDGQEIAGAIREADEEAGTVIVYELADNPTRFRRYKIENGEPVLRTLTGRVQIAYDVGL